MFTCILFSNFLAFLKKKKKHTFSSTKNKTIKIPKISRKHQQSSERGKENIKLCSSFKRKREEKIRKRNHDRGYLNDKTLLPCLSHTRVAPSSFLTRHVARWPFPWRHPAPLFPLTPLVWLTHMARLIIAVPSLQLSLLRNGLVGVCVYAWFGAWRRWKCAGSTHIGAASGWEWVRFLVHGCGVCSPSSCILFFFQKGFFLHDITYARRTRDFEGEEGGRAGEQREWEKRGEEREWEKRGEKKVTKNSPREDEEAEMGWWRGRMDPGDDTEERREIVRCPEDMYMILSCIFDSRFHSFPFAVCCPWLVFFISHKIQPHARLWINIFPLQPNFSVVSFWIFFWPGWECFCFFFFIKT